MDDIQVCADWIMNTWTMDEIDMYSEMEFRIELAGMFWVTIRIVIRSKQLNSMFSAFICNYVSNSRELWLVSIVLK